MAETLTETTTPVETGAAIMAAAIENLVMAEVEATVTALVAVAVDMEATHSSKFFLYGLLD